MRSLPVMFAQYSISKTLLHKDYINIKLKVFRLYLHENKSG